MARRPIECGACGRPVAEHKTDCISPAWRPTPPAFTPCEQRLEANRALSLRLAVETDDLREIITDAIGWLIDPTQGPLETRVERAVEMLSSSRDVG